MSVKPSGRQRPVKIDDEFQSLIPSLTEEERTQLTANINRDGCRDPLVVWAGHDILLDGHNRYAICTRDGIPFQVIGIELADRDEAKVWIIDNQRGRRNLNNYQKTRLELQRKDIVNARAHQNVLTPTGGISRLTLQESGKLRAHTDKQIAKNAGVSHDTVHKVSVILRRADEETRGRLERGEVSVNAAYNNLRAGVHFSSDSDEWRTPDAIIKRVIKVLGKIDLDPCSDSHAEPHVPARHHFTREDDGLSREWPGRVYMNPPYGREIRAWVAKLVEEYESGRVGEAIALLPSRTDTEWFKGLRDYPRCFLGGRLSFSDHSNSAPFPSMVVYLGNQPWVFADVFEDVGDVYQRVGLGQPRAACSGDNSKPIRRATGALAGG